MDQFRYSAVDLSKREIRILHPQRHLQLDFPAGGGFEGEPLYPSLVPDLTLHFELRTVSLDDKPLYTALSYVWGQLQGQQLITVNECDFPVTPNLHKALQHLQYKDVAPGIWIDSVCINQKDDKEKSQQVSLMGSIYSSAHHVVIWLGEEQVNSKFFAKATYEFGRLFRQHFNILDSQDDGLMEYFEFDSLMAGDIDEMITQAIKSVDETAFMNSRQFLNDFFEFTIGRPWWYRVWVIQEFVLATKCHFQIGCERIDVDELSTLMVIGMLMNSIFGLLSRSPLDSKPHDLKYGYDWILTMVTHRLQQHPKQRGQKMYDVLCKTYCRPASRSETPYLAASNKLDYIYGLRSLFQNHFNALGLTVNYSKSWEDLYGEVAQELLLAGDMDLLALSQKAMSETIPVLPSWAPNWHEKIQFPSAWFRTAAFNDGTIMGNSLFLASSGSEVEARSSLAYDLNERPGPIRSILFRGVLIDKILEAKSTYLRSESLETSEVNRLLGSLFEDISSLCKQSKRLGFGTYTASSLREAVWRIPIRDHEAAFDGTDKFRRATQLSHRRYKKYSLLFQAYGAQIATERISQQSPGTTLFERWSAKLRLWSCRFLLSAYTFLFKTSQYNLPMRVWCVMKSLPNIPLAREEIKGLKAAQNMEYQMYFGSLLGPPTKPFITERGYIGLGPRYLQPGDALCILFGARVPHVLRPRTEGQRGYLFVGEAYVHSIMDGEGIRDISESMEFKVF